MIEDFYDDLNDNHCSKDDYKFAKDMYKELNCLNFHEYASFYLKLDVLLLCDIYLNFRDLCINNYKLSPDNYLTLPGLSNDTCLKMYT